VVVIDTGSILTLVPVLLGLWIIVSIPVYLAASVVTSGRAKFTQAMGATILGPLAYLAVVVVSTVILGSIIGGMATLLAIVLALIVWFWIYKTSFKTGWLAAIGIAILAIIVFIVMSFIIMLVMEIFLPGIPQPILPVPLQQI
tara:strand:+ start:2851 stop:3279 length:429 start_codon:yes stop_codon:yes gene_type:complete